jgi:hypothetical protein
MDVSDEVFGEFDYVIIGAGTLRISHFPIADRTSVGTFTRKN